MIKENNPFYGKTHSEESINKIRDGKLGKKQTEEHIRKVKEAKVGFKHSKETLEKMKHSHKKPEKLECPHCGLNGGSSNTKRWHFDNCESIIKS